MAVDTQTPLSGGGRRLYTGAAIVAVIIVFAGFARTYYLKELTGAAALPTLVHLHGLVMTSWFVLFFVQSTLVARRQVAMHRKLGVAGALLAAIMVVVGILTAIEGARRGVTPGPPPLVFLIIPFADILVFAALVSSALYFRAKRQVHSRLMLLASLGMLTPAIARIPIALVAKAGVIGFFGLTDLIILTFIAIDTKKNGRVHPALLWGTVFVVASQVGRFAFAGTDLWMRIATWLVS